MKTCLKDNVLLTMHFRELALRFVDSFNPKLDKEIIVADAVCSYDGELDLSVPVRYQAHAFVHAAVGVIVNGNRDRDRDFSGWLVDWNTNFGILNKDEWAKEKAGLMRSMDDTE